MKMIDVFLFTGLSGAGKTTLTRQFTNELQAVGYRVELLDGDVIRRDICRDLSFSKADRIENIRRLGEAAVAHLQAGVEVVIIAAIAPYRRSRDELRHLLALHVFDLCEVFVDCPLDVVTQRDPKGLYAKAFRGEIQNFTGVSDPYEQPEAFDVRIPTAEVSIDEGMQLLHAYCLKQAQPRSQPSLQPASYPR